MKKEEFVDYFVINFVSTWCASNYDKYCLYNAQEKLHSPPIEDAYDIAEAVWQKMIKYKNFNAR